MRLIRLVNSVRLIGVLLLCSLMLPAGIAQRAVPRSHQAWSTEEGLPDASVHAMLQSRDGYLWLGTEAGVARFDGAGFRTFRHDTQTAFTSDDISAIAQDRSGTLWFGTAEGLVAMQGSSFHRLTTNDGLPSDRVLQLAPAGDGSLLVLTAKGLVRWDGHTFQPLAPAGHVLSIASVQDGSVELFTADHGPLLYAHSPLTREAAAPSVAEPVLGIASGPEHTTWSYTQRAVVLSSREGHRTFRVGADLPGSRVTAFLFDTAGTAWIGTNRGLVTITPHHGSAPQVVDALRSDSILALMVDREGNIWVGTESTGVHVLRPRKFSTLSATAGEAVTAAVATAPDRGWFGTRDDGLHQVQGETITQPVPPGALTSPVILSLAKGTRGDLWAGTPDGLNHIDGKQVTKYTSADGLPDDFTRSILVDAEGAVWAGTRRGLARLQRGKIDVLTRANGLGSDSIGPLLLDTYQEHAEQERDDLWIGTSAGLSHLRAGKIETFTAGSEGNSIVTALAQSPGGDILAGVHGAGLHLLRQTRLISLPVPGVPQEISSLLFDATGYLWIRGPHAIYRAPWAGLQQCAVQSGACTVQVQAFNTADGLPSDTTVAEGSPLIARAEDGELWFATSKGIGVTDPAHLSINDVPPPVVIQRFTVDDVDQPLAPASLDITPGHSRYTFDFAALSYTLPSRIRYRYKLEGFDRDWIDAGSAHTAYYTSLPPHAYRFRVLAENNDGIWNNTGAEVSFRLLPPIYRRWWFYTLVILLAAAIAAAALRLRERAVQRRFALVLQERNRMAREVHDTLAQDLVSVSLQLDLASGLLRNQQLEAAATQLQQTRKLVKDGLQAARQSIWNLRANAGEDSLPTRLSALVTRYAGKGVPPRLSMGGAFRRLPDNTEMQVLRIAQESLSNIDRHAGAAEVNVNLFYEADKLLLTIRDNGRGFARDTADKLEGHYGLKGMRERAAALGADLSIASQPGEGTSVTLQVPLHGKDDKRS